MEAARPRVSAVRNIRNNGSKPVLSTGHCLFHYCRRRAPGENQPPRRSQTPRTEPPLGNRGHTLGHGEIYRPASEQMALNLRCPFYTLEGGGPEPAPGSNRGTSGEAFTLDPRFRVAFAGMTIQSGPKPVILMTSCSGRTNIADRPNLPLASKGSFGGKGSFALVPVNGGRAP